MHIQSVLGHTRYVHTYLYAHTYTRTHIHYIHSVPYLLVYTEDSVNPGLKVLGGNHVPNEHVQTFF